MMPAATAKRAMKEPVTVYPAAALPEAVAEALAVSVPVEEPDPERVEVPEVPEAEADDPVPVAV
jgi:hypothetical protein